MARKVQFTVAVKATQFCVKPIVVWTQTAETRGQVGQLSGGSNNVV